jgi:Ca2+-binding RTX toxin-like protein
MSAGDIDSKYGIVDLGVNGGVTTTKVTADGSILVAATPGVVGVQRISSVSKYKADGTLDESFGNKGVFNLAADQRVKEFREASDGIFVLLSNDDKTKNELIKLKSNGSIDTSFQKISTDPFDATSSFAVTSDNTIVALTSGGSISTYSADGKLKSTANGVLKGRGNATVTPDGKVIASYDDLYGLGGDIPFDDVVKYNSDGSIDTSLAKNSYTLSYPDIIATNNGGFYEYRASGSSGLIKHLANGSIDRNFGNSGSIDLSVFFRVIADGPSQGPSRDETFSLGNKPFFTSDGKIFIAGTYVLTATGEYLTSPALARYNADGTLDKTFGDGGIRLLSGSNGVNGIGDITIQKDGDIFTVDGDNLIRYKSDGSTPIAENRVGTDNADTLAGGSGNDVIFGRAGNDLLLGASGNDSIDGENGNDTIFGGKGDDFLYGANGNDSLLGDIGNDYLNGGNDNDVLVGGDGADTLLGELGDDFLYGGNDNDQLLGGVGNDFLNGGNGNDSIFGGDDTDTIVGDRGNDSINGGNGNDFLFGGDDADTIVGGDGADSIEGVQGNDFLYGGNGNDSIFGGADNDSINGGYGDDYLIGNTGNDTLFGDVGNDYLHGYEGDDKLFGGDGNDILEDSTGANILSAGNGNDILFSGSTNTLTGGAGNDTFGGFYGGTATITDFQSGTDKISLNKNVFSALQSLKGDGFSIANEFAVVNNSSAVDSSKALIVYNTQTGNLTYNLDREVVGISNRDEFAKLQGTPNLTANDFVIT